MYHQSRPCAKVRQATQPAFNCSNLTIETLEEGVKYVQSWCRSSVSIVNPENVNTGWLDIVGEVFLNLISYVDKIWVAS